MSKKIVGLIFLFCILGMVLFFILNQRDVVPDISPTDALNKATSTPLATSTYPSATPEEVSPAQSTFYRNEQFHFSLLQPKSLSVREVRDAGALTVIFQSNAGEAGFQVFALPYNEKKITEARFLKDIPSGIRLNERALTIDGVPAVIFESESIIGKTVEVWFINKGVLYEVTTYVEFGPSLEQLLATWKFI